MSKKTATKRLRHFLSLKQNSFYSRVLGCTFVTSPFASLSFFARYFFINFFRGKAHSGLNAFSDLTSVVAPRKTIRGSPNFEYLSLSPKQIFAFQVMSLFLTDIIPSSFVKILNFARFYVVYPLYKFYTNAVFTKKKEVAHIVVWQAIIQILRFMSSKLNNANFLFYFSKF